MRWTVPAPSDARPRNGPARSVFLSVVVFGLVLAGLVMLLMVVGERSFPGFDNFTHIPLILFGAILGISALFLPTPVVGRQLITMAAMPLALTGSFGMVLGSYGYVPVGFGWPGFFADGEREHAVILADSPSPTNRYSASVILGGIGAYCGGWGRVSVDVRDCTLPFMQHRYLFPQRIRDEDLYQDLRNGVREQRWIEWIDDQRLRCRQTGETVSVGTPWTLCFSIWLALATLGWCFGRRRLSLIDRSAVP